MDMDMDMLAKASKMASRKGPFEPELAPGHNGIRSQESTVL
jgi:hypothetical protein